MKVYDSPSAPSTLNDKIQAHIDLKNELYKQRTSVLQEGVACLFPCASIISLAIVSLAIII